MREALALITIIIWPVVPLFWIPVHGLSRIFRRLGLLTYIMPLVTWLPLAYLLYQERGLLLRCQLDLPLGVNIIGLILLTAGTVLHLWTGKLLGLWGLIGLPEVSRRTDGRLVDSGPFSVVRHPTYLAHTMMFTGVFLMTGVVAVAIITALDFIVINLLIIPLEEQELEERFGEEYGQYRESVRSRFFPW